jgi:hypothetical protein
MLIPNIMIHCLAVVIGMNVRTRTCGTHPTDESALGKKQGTETKAADL